MKAASSTLVPLTTLRTGATATVHRRDLTCDDCELLSAMGLRDQCRLRVCRAGSPCIVEIDRTRLGLCATVADQVLVALDD